MATHSSTVDELEQRVQTLTTAIREAKRQPCRTSSYRAGPYNLRAPGHPYYYGPDAHKPGPHRNRSLVIQQQRRETDKSSVQAPTTATQTNSGGWVSTRGRHYQLINKAVYEQRQEEANESSDSHLNRPSVIPTFPRPGAPYTRPKTATHPTTVIKTQVPCRTFSTTGECRRGPKCKYQHDPEKIAICKEFLSKGTCKSGDSCNLSHEPNAHRSPACIHFVRGNCTNEKCRYAHVNVSKSSPICPAFANLGYCEKGDKCADLHDFECPEYRQKGSCGNPKCRLPHIDRAGQLRQKASSGKATDSSSKVCPGATEVASVEHTSEMDVDVTTPDADGHDASPPFIQRNFVDQPSFVSINVDPDGEYERRHRSSSLEPDN